MGIFSFMKDQDLLQAHVHDWLEKRRALKRAELRTLESMIAEETPLLVDNHFEEEDKIHRQLAKLEVKIDAMLMV